MKKFEPGQTIAERYFIIDTIGTGGFSTLYRAMDLRLNRIIALKILHSEWSEHERFVKEFLKEAKILREFDHPNIPHFYDCEQYDEIIFSVMEYVDGHSLQEELLQNGGNLSIDQALDIAKQVGYALSYAHNRGVIHGDIKPSNILIDHMNNVFLSDFGSAKLFGESAQLKNGEVVGTVRYMSPEQIQGDRLDQRSDIYSFGIVIFQMLTGELLFRANNNFEYMNEIINFNLPDIDDYAPAIRTYLDILFRLALQKSPHDRVDSVDELIDALFLHARVSPSYMNENNESIGRRVIRLLKNLFANANQKPVKTIIDQTGPAGTISSPFFGIVPLLDQELDEVTEPLIPSSSIVTDVTPAQGDRLAWLLIMDVTRTSVHEKFDLSKYREIRIGRDPSRSKLVLANRSVSRLHARIQYRDGYYYLYDEGSSVGTRVNGELLPFFDDGYQLKDRDEIDIGNVRLVFMQLMPSRSLTIATRKRLEQLEFFWKQLQMAIANNDEQEFVSLIKNVTDDLLTNVFNIKIKGTIPYNHGIAGFIVDAPSLWVRASHFPMLFLNYDETDQIMDSLIERMKHSGASDYFGILVVISPYEDDYILMNKFRQMLNASVHSFDFVIIDYAILRQMIVKDDEQQLLDIVLDQGVSRMKLSPYTVSGPVSPHMFFGREFEIKTVVSGLTKRQSVAIIGGRRIGKSSILQRLDYLLTNSSEYNSHYINCEEVRHSDDFFFLIKEKFNISIDAVSSVQLRILVDKVNEYFNSIPIFLLDEVDELINNDFIDESSSLLKSMRSLTHEGKCIFLFAGGRTLSSFVHNPKSPLFNFVNILNLRQLDQRSVVELIQKPMQQLHIALRDKEYIIDKIIQATDCHPNLVQWVGQELVLADTNNIITQDDIERVLTKDEFFDFYLETAWGDTTPLERLISISIVHDQFTTEDVIKSLKGLASVTLDEINEALYTLHLYALIERSGQNFRFSMKNFPKIVRKRTDIKSLQETYRQKINEVL